MSQNIRYLLIGLLAALALAACKSTRSSDQTAESSQTVSPGSDQEAESTKASTASGEEKPKVRALGPPDDPSLEVATFAGGCFWCMEPPFDKTAGVVRTIVGYTGGDQEHPAYKEVASGKTSHAEAVRVYYKPDEVSYETLLGVFWRNINPTQKNGQFVDIGRQYRTAIFYHGESQKELAEQSKRQLAASGRFDKPIVTAVEPAETFWRAEEYHQDFYKKSPVRYKAYRSGSGRDEYIERVWGDDKIGNR